MGHVCFDVYADYYDSTCAVIENALCVCVCVWEREREREKESLRACMGEFALTIVMSDVCVDMCAYYHDSICVGIEECSNRRCSN